MRLFQGNRMRIFHYALQVKYQIKWLTCPLLLCAFNTRTLICIFKLDWMLRTFIPYIPRERKCLHSLVQIKKAHGPFECATKLLMLKFRCLIHSASLCSYYNLRDDPDSKQHPPGKRSNFKPTLHRYTGK